MFFTDIFFEVIVFVLTGWLAQFLPATQIQIINGG